VKGLLGRNKENTMVKRTGKTSEEEPEQSSFEVPSEKEHLFQVADVFDSANAPEKMPLDSETVVVKCEVVGGDEEGRTLLNRLTLDFNGKGFWATRLFLKAIDLPHKGEIEIDTDQWQGLEFYATVVHDGKYANIGQFNFEKTVVQEPTDKVSTGPDADVSWDE